MATNDPQDEISVLKEKNNELVQKAQHWKILAGQREKEKLELMKELGEMRLKLSRFRSNGNVQASKLDAALQSASQNALEHLVRASNEIARSIDLSKAYMRERTELEGESQRWSTIIGIPNVKSEKVHRVPPMMIGGQSIQPVVSLSRTLLNTTNTGPAARSSNQRSVTRPLPLPMHMLQDVYIPLTRIDAGEPPQPMDTEPESANDSLEETQLDNSSERDPEEPQILSQDEDYNYSRRMDTLAEDIEPEEGEESPSRPVRTENPLEGPSWLLDAHSSSRKQCSALSPMPLGRGSFEPDSTTEMEEMTPVSRYLTTTGHQSGKPCSVRLSNEFTPTVRRRKRTPSPPSSATATPTTPRRAVHCSPRPAHARRTSTSGRVLKVMVAKMRLDSLSPGSPPAKRQASLATLASLSSLDMNDAPSPNGATVPGVIVSSDLRERGAGEPHVTRRPSLARCRARRAPRDDNDDTHEHTRQQESRDGSCDSRSSDSVDGEGRGSRSRRPRNVVSYQEKPLNRKLRR